jgi:hypothetical protein
MDDLFARAIHNLFGRLDGPMEIRLIIQPIMAAIFAVRDGLEDFREGRAPYGWSLMAEPHHRAHRLREGWRSIRKVFFAALAIDVVYQIVELKWVYLGEALIIAQIVALIPYVLIRGLVDRIAGMLRR